MRVQFPDAIFLPESIFSADSLKCVRTPVYAITCINICVQVKHPVIHVRAEWIMETLKHPASIESRVARLCRSWLFPGQVTWISHGRNPNRTTQLKKKLERSSEWFHGIRYRLSPPASWTSPTSTSLNPNLLLNKSNKSTHQYTWCQSRPDGSHGDTHTWSSPGCYGMFPLVRRVHVALYTRQCLKIFDIIIIAIIIQSFPSCC